MRRVVLNRGGLLAAIVGGGCVLAGLAPGAASATRLEIQFHAPAAGAIELIAVPYQVHFKGPPPPLHPAGLRVSLPRSGPPHSYGLLAGELRTRVRGHTATYVLLIEALRALTSANAAQPLVSVDRNLTASNKGITGTLHPMAGRLVIDNDTEAEREAFQHTLAQSGVSKHSAADFHIGHFEGHAFHWDAAKQRVVWDDAWISVGLPQSGVQVQLVKIEKTLGKPFKLAKPFEVPPSPPATPPAKELTMECPATAEVGGTIPLTGTGPPGASVTITYTTPAASLPITVPVTIGSSGSYTDSITAGVAGTYTFQAFSRGGSLGAGATSPKCTTSVMPWVTH
jgi:hypothetical protein